MKFIFCILVENSFVQHRSIRNLSSVWEKCTRERDLDKETLGGVANVSSGVRWGKIVASEAKILLLKFKERLGERKRQDKRVREAKFSSDIQRGVFWSLKLSLECQNSLWKV